MRISAAELVADVGDQRQLAFVQKLGDALDQTRLLNQPRNFGDHDLVGAAPAVFLAPARPHPERATAGRIGLGDRFLAVDHDAAGRKVRTGDVFQQRLGTRIGIVDQEQGGVAQLGRVVRRNRGRHADRDALRAVRQQVREGARQHRRLFGQAVIVRAEVDRVLVDALEQKPRDFGHARFGVTIGGGVIAVDIAEIPLPVDQRIARGEILREPHQRVVDRLVAMRMEITHHVADDLRRLLRRGSRIEPEQLHAVKDATMHRFQSVARIRQGAVHDGRERIGEIALFQRVPQRDLLHVLVRWGNQSSAHAGSVLRNRALNKQ